MAVMSMQELFYGEMEPSYLVHYGRPTCSQSYVSGHQLDVPHQVIPRVTPLDFTDVPMCSNHWVTPTEQALQGLQNGAILCPRSSSYTTQRYQSRPSPSLGSHRGQQQYISEFESYADHHSLRPNRDSSYSRSHCPTYRPSAGTTHYVSVGQSRTLPHRRIGLDQ